MKKQKEKLNVYSWKNFPAPSLTIEYSVVSDDCSPTYNADWVISTPIYCADKKIDIGTGNLIILNDGVLGLTRIQLLIAEIKFDYNATKKWFLKLNSDSNISMRQ